MRLPGPIFRSSALFLVALLGVAQVAPATADTYPRQHGIDVEEYVFRLAFNDESNDIEGLATVALRFLEEGVGEVYLDLVGNVGGAETGMRVTDVRLARGDQEAVAMHPAPDAGALGTEATHSHTGDRLRIVLDPAPAAGERRFVSIAYGGEPATGLIIGDNKHGDRTFFSDNWPSKARNWLPTVDHVYDKARMQMVVTAPSHYQVISNGLLVEQTDVTPATRRTHWKQSVPIVPWLYVVGAARFAVQHLGVHRGIPVQTWVYHQDRDAGFYDFAYPTREALDFYSEWVGPFAYEKLANIQSNSVGGGMEAATAILYGDASVTGTRSTRWRNVIVHEIAHQWFGNAVTESDWDDVWLSEGFATYFTALFIEHAYGRDEFVATMTRARDRVFDFYSTRPEYRIVHDNLADMRDVTTGMQYQKGSWVLHMLRHQIGTETFWEGIRRYYARYYNGHATTTQFREVMEEVSGQDLETFFQQWLYRGSAGLVLEGTWSYEANNVAGNLQLNLNQAQAGGTVYAMPLTVRATGADGETSQFDVPVHGPQDEIWVTVEFEPVSVELDPDTWLLARTELRRR